MHLTLRTAVAQPPAQVMAGFTRALFVALAPPFPRLRVLRFDGCRTGDQVEIELNTLVTRLRWTSLIVDHGHQPDGTHFFVDEGQVLPPPLRYWRHRHLIEPGPDGGSVIVDALEYRTASPLLDRLLYPACGRSLPGASPFTAAGLASVKCSSEKYPNGHAELVEASRPLRCNGVDEAGEMLRPAQHDRFFIYVMIFQIASNISNGYMSSTIFTSVRS
jgi:ligand-binding SRPBCC domain-containing protein